MTTIQSRVQHKRDTSSNWEQNNPVLLAGEIIIVDTNAGERRTKTGDGIKRYNELPFDDESVRNLVSSKDAETLQIAKEYTNEKFTNISANDVEFTDGQTFQQKYDAGQLTGPAGANGSNGKDGSPGADGEDGGYYKPAVDGSGNLTWTASKSGMPAVSGTNIKGATGPAGTNGTDGKNATINGVNALTLNTTGGITGNQSGNTYTIDGSGKLDNPSGGTTGQILEKTATGTQWADKPASGMSQTSADARYLQLSGGEVNGEVKIRGNPLTFVELSYSALPVRDEEVSISQAGIIFYDDDGSAIYTNRIKGLSIDGTIMVEPGNGGYSMGCGGGKINNVGAPEYNSDAANKAYVDSIKTTVAVKLVRW